MSTRLVAHHDSDSIQSNQKTKVTYLWGLLQSKDIPAGCESNSLCNVTTQTNFGFILVSAVTLGAVVPQKVVWNCCPTPEEEEVLK